MPRLVIATRGSQLALWQANHVKDRLQALDPELSVELAVIKTPGDKILDVPLAQGGGKGLFVKEIEDALLSGAADLAVHSIKDVPMELPAGLVLGCVPKREVFADCLVSERYQGLRELPKGAKVGTSSLRRQSQLLALRPDLQVESLRGNVDTRLRKLREGLFDAILLASAGLVRLGLEAPQSWDDLLKPEYKGLIWLSNYNTAGTPKLVANLMIQLKGHDAGIQYLVDLDKNVQIYTKSGSGPSKNVGTGECVIGIGFLHDGITQIVDNGYENVKLIVPSDGTACEIGPVAIFKGAAHMNAAKLFMEFALSPDCVELAAQNGSYQFLVIDNAKQPEAAAKFGLDPSLVWDGYDFAKAAAETKQNVEDVMAALNGGDDRFKTE